MKKKVLTVIICIVIMFGAVFVPSIVAGNVPTANLIKPFYDTFTQSVEGSGTVASDTNSDIVFDIPLIASKIDVSPGDYVNKGQRLFVVDKESTIQALLGIADMMDLFPSYLNEEKILSDLLGSSGEIDEYLNLEQLPTAVYSPISGNVSEVNISNDSLYDMTEPAVSISRGESKVAKLYMMENDIIELEIGQSVYITGPAIEEPMYGYLSEISDYVSSTYSGITQKSVVEVSVNIDDSEDVILDGASVEGEIFIEPKRDVLVVPYQCVMQDDDGREYVLEYISGNLKKIYITTNAELSSGFEVTNGLSGEENIVVYPSNYSENSLVIPNYIQWEG